MNILIVALDFKPNMGGVAEYTHQIAHHLGRCGDDVVVLTKGIDKSNRDDGNSPYRVIGFSHEDHSAPNVIRQIRQLAIVKSTAKRHLTDVIISNEYGALVHINWMVSRLLAIPFVIFTHGRDVKIDAGWYSKYERRLLLRHANKIFSNSSFTQNEIIDFGVPADRTAIVHPGVSETFLHNLLDTSGEESKERFGLKHKDVLLTLGRLVERKGIDKTIEAVNILQNKFPDIAYLVVGDGPYRYDLERLVERFNLREKVIFTGYVSEKDKSLYYTAADVFVLPNRELQDGDAEGFGISFLEANACSKPVIGGKSGGAVDAIQHGRTGLLVNPIDVNELVESIAHLLENPIYAQQLGLQGKKRVMDEFRWEKIVARMRSELKGLCS